MKTTDVVVKFDHSDVYRQNTGLDLLREAVSLLNRRKPKILEIGPGQGEIMESAILKSNLAEEMITFLEPNTESSKQLHNKFPKSEIIHSPLEGFLNTNPKGQKYDLIFADFSLHWVENLDEQIVKIANLLNKGGLLVFANTDSSRSFWGQIDTKVQDTFNGSKLFNIQKSHSMSDNQWVDIFASSKEGSLFRPLSLKRIHGVAGVFKSPQDCLNNFKFIVGSKYLKIGFNTTQKSIEDFILSHLTQYQNSNGEIEVSASGFQVILEKI